jgi:hypothetical protein
MRTGLDALRTTGSDDLAVWFVDEVGPLEMQGKGWDPALPGVFALKAGAVVLAVRPDLVGAVQDRYGIPAAQVWDAASLRTGGHVEILRALLTSVTIPAPKG